MRPARLVSLGLVMGVVCLVGRASASPHIAPPHGPASLTASSPLDAAWSSQFGLPICNGLMRAITSYGGQIVVGGYFTQAGSARAHHVAAWDGSSWHALGDGLQLPVEALAVYGGQLIAASGPSVFAWDGAQWNALGSSNAAVHALAVYNGELYAGGQFTTMNGIFASRIARWDGTQWQAAGAGITVTVTVSSPSVRALAVYGTKLVAAGKFSDLQSIATWDGASWSGLASGLQLSGTNADVKGLVVAGADLVAVGVFDHAGATLLNNVARWNGSSWSNIGQTQAPDAVGQWLGSPVAGASISGAVRPARWDGAAWVSDGSPPVQPFAFHNDGSAVYCGGFATSVLAPDGFARFDGVSWTALQESWAPGMSGLPGAVNDLLGFNGSLYAAGESFIAGANDHWVATSRVAIWDGNAWTSTPSTLGGGAYSLAAFGSSLVAGGHGWVARLDPGAWTQIGASMGGDVDAIAQHGTDLVAIGNFSGGIKRWNGTSWSALGSGLDTGLGDQPAAVTSYGGEIVVGGYLTSSGGTTIHHLVHWNGATFQDLGGGTDGPVAALAVSGGDLLVGGSFTHVGGVEAHAAARWNGSNWTAIGDNAEYVTRFREHGGRLFAAGEFVDAAGEEAYGVAVWNGERWYPLGSGVDGSAYALDFLGDDLYLGGTFGWGFGGPSFNMAGLPAVSLVGVGGTPRVPALSLVAGPNPSRGSTRFTISLPAAGHVRLTVHDVSGRVVAVLADEDRVAGESFVTWTGRAAPGIYLATIETAGAKRTTRVVRLD